MYRWQSYILAIANENLQNYLRSLDAYLQDLAVCGFNNVHFKCDNAITPASQTNYLYG